ncbi:MAG: DNA polymerase ligase N-terminal domain-containing protein [Patescibacteria group bacterium]
MNKLSKKDIIFVDCLADWPDLIKQANENKTDANGKDITDDWVEEYKKNPIIKEEKNTQVKDVELWHGVNDEKALQKLPNGKYLLTPRPGSDLQKLWFVPTWNSESKRIAVSYANYALVRVMVPFEFTYMKTTRKNGEINKYTESYKPTAPKWERSYQVQEWFLHEGGLEVDPNQIKLAGDLTDEIISLYASASISKRAKEDWMGRPDLSNTIDSETIIRIYETEYKLFKLKSLDSSRPSTLKTIEKYKNSLNLLLPGVISAMKETYKWWINHHKEWVTSYDFPKALALAIKEYPEIEPKRLERDYFDNYSISMHSKYRDIFDKMQNRVEKEEWSKPPLSNILQAYKELQKGTSGNINQDMVLFHKGLTTLHFGGPMMNHFAKVTGVSTKLLTELSEGKLNSKWDNDISKFARFNISKRAGRIDVSQKLIDTIYEDALKSLSCRDVIFQDAGVTNPPQLHLINSYEIDSYPDFGLDVLLRYDLTESGSWATYKTTDNRGTLLLCGFPKFLDDNPDKTEYMKKILKLNIEHELTHMMQYLMSPRNDGDRSYGLPSSFNPHTLKRYKETKDVEEYRKWHNLSDIEFFPLLNDSINRMKQYVFNADPEAMVLLKHLNDPEVFKSLKENIPGGDTKLHTIDVNEAKKIAKERLESFLTHDRIANNLKTSPSKYKKYLREMHRAFEQELGRSSKNASTHISKRAARIDYPKNMFNEIMAWAKPVIMQESKLITELAAEDAFAIVKEYPFSNKSGHQSNTKISKLMNDLRGRWSDKYDEKEYKDINILNVLISGDIDKLNLRKHKDESTFTSSKFDIIMRPEENNIAGQILVSYPYIRRIDSSFNLYSAVADIPAGEHNISFFTNPETKRLYIRTIDEDWINEQFAKIKDCSEKLSMRYLITEDIEPIEIGYPKLKDVLITSEADIAEFTEPFIKYESFINAANAFAANLLGAIKAAENANEYRDIKSDEALSSRKIFNVDISDVEQWSKHEFMRNNWSKLSKSKRMLTVILLNYTSDTANGNYNAETNTIQLFNTVANIAKFGKDNFYTHVGEMENTLKHELVHMMQTLMTELKKLDESKGFQSEWYCPKCGFVDKQSNHGVCPTCNFQMIERQLGGPGKYNPKTYQRYTSESSGQEYYKQHALSDVEFFTRLQNSVEEMKSELTRTYIDPDDNKFLTNKFPSITDYELKPYNMSSLTPEQKGSLKTIRFQKYLEDDATLKHLRNAGEKDKVAKYIRELYRAAKEILTEASVNIPISKRAINYGWWLSPEGKLHPIGVREHRDFVINHPEFFANPLYPGMHPYQRAFSKDWIRIAHSVKNVFVEMPHFDNRYLFRAQKALQDLPPYELVVISSASVQGAGTENATVPYWDFMEAKSLNELKNIERRACLSKRAMQPGWWLSPEGNLHDVGFSNHQEFIYHHPEIFGERKFGQEVYDLAYSKGWIRIDKAYGKISIRVPVPFDESKLRRIQAVMEDKIVAPADTVCYIADDKEYIKVYYDILVSAKNIKELKSNQTDDYADDCPRAMRNPPQESVRMLEQMAKDPLSKYKEKRDFDSTKEPEGKIEKGKNQYRFVIQKHDAEKAGTHYDLRLENDKGAMSSWAIPKARLPKGKEKLLAQKVEDHPTSYNIFEGKIEEGYGKGVVAIHDSGHYEEIEKTNKKIKFKLNGKKEKGTYVLINTDGKRWLILAGKEED